MEWKDKLWYEVRDSDDNVLATCDTRSQAMSYPTTRYQAVAIYECRFTLMNTIIPNEETELGTFRGKGK